MIPNTELQAHVSLELRPPFRLMPHWTRLQPVVIAKKMQIPTYLVFDADADKPDHNGSLAKHERDNKALLSLAGVQNPDPMPNETFWTTGLTMWHSDIGSIVQEEIGCDEWMTFCQQADKRYGHVGKMRKNALHIGASLAFAWEAGKQSSSLERLCGEILDPENAVGTKEI